MTYGVWSWSDGHLWQVTPPTKANAEREAALIDADIDYVIHQAVTTEVGLMLQNAYNHGAAAMRKRLAPVVVTVQNPEETEQETTE